jgi:hypothetical protein
MTQLYRIQSCSSCWPLQTALAQQGGSLWCLTEKQLLNMTLKVTVIPGLQEAAQPPQQQEQDAPHMQQQQQQADDMDLQWQQKQQQQQADWQQRLQQNQEPVRIAVLLDASDYCFMTIEGSFRNNDWDYHLQNGNRRITPMTSAARNAFSAQLAAQMEQLLYIA